MRSDGFGCDTLESMSITSAFTDGARLAAAVASPEGKWGARIVKAAGVLAASIGAYEIARNIYEESREYMAYSITIDESRSPALYSAAMDWLVQQTSLSMRHGVYTTIPRQHSPHNETSYNLWVAAGERYSFTLDGYKIYFEVTGHSRKNTATNSPVAVIFYARTRNAYDRLVALMNKFAEASKARAATVFLPNSYEGWSDSGRPVRRNLESVIMRGDQKNELFADLQTFIDSEEFYISHGIPYHRGYLLYGPPGTGKSSLAEAMATYLGASIYALNVASVESDSQLLELISEIRNPKESLLLLEDVDSAQVVKKRTNDNGDKGGGVTLSALLNLFDGLQTPHGLIHVMTTNHRERLDPALIRPGRADHEVYMDYMDQEQFERMYAFYGGTGKVPTLERTDLAPSAIADAFKRAGQDPEKFSELVAKVVRAPQV